jgi:chemotaxis protein methyltransferase CheR
MNAGDEGSFQTLTQTISQGAGLALHAYKQKCLRRRIAVRMRACGVHTYEAYQSLLAETPDEYQRLKDTLTINVTRFYRNPETWESLADTILPALFQAREGNVRVWSAGCASGEEPHTLAMLFADQSERLGRRHWLDRVHIDATDIDRECLVRAGAGRYSASAFDEAPERYREEYCLAVGDEYEVIPRLRSMVHVQYLDLIRDAPLHSAYDLIVCRNVVIYFDRPTQLELFQSFADVLSEDGALVLGKVETMFGEAQKRFTLLDIRERIYRVA